MLHSFYGIDAGKYIWRVGLTLHGHDNYVSSCWRFTDSLPSLWHTALMKILLIEDNQKTTIQWVRQGRSRRQAI